MNQKAKEALAGLSGPLKSKNQWIEELQEMRFEISAAMLRGAGMVQIHKALNSSGFKVPYRLLSNFINKEIKKKKKGKGILKDQKVKMATSTKNVKKVEENTKKRPESNSGLRRKKYKDGFRIAGDDL